METLIIRMGSSSTTIYREGEGIVLKEASLVAVSGDGKEQVVKAVGDRAKYMQGRTTGDTHIVSPIYEGVINDTELATIMLEFFLNKIYGKSLFRPKICAILSVPIGISLSERKAFEKVCYNAKILDVELIPNVFCGALGMNLDIHTPRGVMVVNIGGTTTNVAVLGLNNILSGACICLGGKNIDVAIENEIKNKFKMKIGDAVIVFGQVSPDTHSMTFFAVEGTVNEFHLAHSVIQKFLQCRIYLLQRHKPHAFFNGG